MSEVSAIVAGSICLVNPGPRISDRLQHELSYPNPAYNVTFITKQHHARENIPSWVSCMEEFPDGSVRIPRGAVKELKAVLERCETTVRWIDRRSLGVPVPRVDVPLRDYQQEALGKLMQSVQALAMMPCGGGKTRLGVSLIGARAVSTLVLVHTEEILGQWVEDIQKLLGMQAGVVADGEARWAPITVAMVRTLAAQIASADDGPWSEFGMCLCDEAHHVPAKTTFLGILPYVPAKYRYGLTATDRDDELNKVMYWTFQSKVVDVEARYLIKKGFLVPAEIVEVDTDFEFSYDGPDKKRLAQLTRSLVADPKRNDLICKLAADHGARGETVLVLSNNKAHCRRLAKRIVELGTKAIAVVGGLSKKDKAGKPVEDTVVYTKAKRKKAVQQMRDGTEKVIVATSLADEGLDVPRLACVILALPGASRRATRQQLGRAMRPFEGKYPVLYDLVDRKVDTLKRRLSDRRAVYRDIGLI